MSRLPDNGGAPVAGKRDSVLRAGRSLLLRHGIRKVRVEEVCADACVSKRTFYKYFRDKDDLAIAVLAGLFEEGRARLEAVLELDCAVEEKVRRIMEAKSALASETSATFYRDALDDSTAPGRYALQEQHKWDQRVRRFYADAQAQGQIRDDIDLDVLMALLVRCRDLVKDADLQRLVPDFTRLVETVMTLFFYGMLPRPASDKRRAPRGGRKKP
jgi:AcrR family transcriptional regulator